MFEIHYEGNAKYKCKPRSNRTYPDRHSPSSDVEEEGLSRKSLRCQQPRHPLSPVATAPFYNSSPIFKHLNFSSANRSWLLIWKSILRCKASRGVELKGVIWEFASQNVALLYRETLYRETLYHETWYHETLYHETLHRDTLHRQVTCHKTLYHEILYRDILHCIMRHCIASYISWDFVSRDVVLWHMVSWDLVSRDLVSWNIASRDIILQSVALWSVELQGIIFRNF